jgi:hypothetical protein
MMLAWSLCQIVFPTLVLIAAVMIWRRRRRSIGEDGGPYCAACGYNVSGTPAGSPCSECGAELGEEAAITQGGLAVSRKRVALSGVLAVVGALLFVQMTWPVILLYDWRGLTPTFVLRWQAADGDVEPALRLAHRLAREELSPDQVRAVTDMALAVQADETIPWHRVFGDLVEGARHQGHLSEADWKRYIRQGFLASIEAKPEVRAGSVLPIQFWIENPRWDGMDALLPGAVGRVINRRGGGFVDPQSSPWPKNEGMFELRYAVESYGFGDRSMIPFEDPAADHRHSWLPFGSLASIPAARRWPIEFRVPSDLPPGPTTLRVAFFLEIVQRKDAVILDEATVAASWRTVLTQPIVIVPADDAGGGPAVK